MLKSQKSKKRIKTNSFLIAFGIYGGVGVQLAAAVLLGIFLGDYLDKRWHTSPVLFLIGTILGVTAGFYNLIRLLKWQQNRKTRP